MENRNVGSATVIHKCQCYQYVKYVPRPARKADKLTAIFEPIV
jgi:hypothetical protein